MLAARVLKTQGLDLIGITFSTPFFGPKEGQDLSGMAGIPVLVIDITESHLEMLKNPVYGYGSQMNPCIDCHALMLREAGRVMDEQGADFLFTGEVLGQRPMSQRKDSLKSVEKLAGHPGRILRPLSAKLLPPTIVETEGLVDREQLLDIHGRSRRRQMELVESFGIQDYPQPGGGCLLTKEGFVIKLRELFARYPEAGAKDIVFLKWGRHFVLPDGAILCVGRRESDNEKLEVLIRPEDISLRVAEHPGPTAVLIASPTAREDLQFAAEIVAAYSDSSDGEPVHVEWKHGDEAGTMPVTASVRERFQDRLI